MHIYIYIYIYMCTHMMLMLDPTCQPPAPEADGGTALGLLLMHAVADAQTEMPGCVGKLQFSARKTKNLAGKTWTLAALTNGT